MKRLVMLLALVALSGCGNSDAAPDSTHRYVRPPADSHNRFGVRVPGENGDYNLSEEEKRQAAEDLEAYRRDRANAMD